MNSFLKTYAFFLSILLLSVAFVLKPPEGDARQQRSQEKIAALEIDDFVLLSVVDKKPEMKVVGKKGKQFLDFEEFWDFNLVNYSTKGGGLKALKTENNEESFFVSHGLRQEDAYFFDGGIKYRNADGMSFEAIEGVYRPKERIFEAKGSFSAITKEGNFRGKDLYYDAVSGQLNAKFPKGKIWLDG